MRSALRSLRDYLRGVARGASVVSPESAVARLQPRFREPLLSMYRGEPQTGCDGGAHALDRGTKISPAQGLWLYEFCRERKPKETLEIGLAYGYSTLFFLAAAAENGASRHTAVDPVQTSYWHGIGLTRARALAPAGSFEFIEERAGHAATDLFRAKRTFDLIFIDGNHRFDDVLSDFYLYAPLCAVGGHVIFDDSWMGSVATALSFIRANRPDFVEIPGSEPSLVVFKKISGDARRWDDFHAFAVHP